MQDLNAASHRFPLSPAAWLKGQLRVPVIYDVYGAPAQAFEALNRAFDGIRGMHGRWLIDAKADLALPYDRKINAGASSLVARQAVTPVETGPKWLATNIAVPGLRAKEFSLYFLPDQMLVQIGKQFASWRYHDVTATLGHGRMIENGTVPPDAVQVATTWQYANKDGGPDRRFKYNRMLPVMRYAELQITGPGLTLRWQFSDLLGAEAFTSRLKAMPTLAAETTARGETQQAQPAQTASPAAPTYPPGWYPDPQRVASWRWWSGKAWTDHTG
ncbi:DUF2510 domain-containing protein [Nocardia cyriacigeorgica]|uniref:DUF2510 domain-containing protein n=1 Tax=Nocardia cyriacigeorgica TaxID=135487 RepID=UPI002811C609|nr:DUF2510 domain-containing protein [Nocardia cyriacigeorgica]